MQVPQALQLSLGGTQVEQKSIALLCAECEQDDAPDRLLQLCYCRGLTED